MIDPILLSAAPIATFAGQRRLTSASGFFFERAGRLFLVSARHVVVDEPSEHFPDRIEIELHTDSEDLVSTTGFSIPLYRNGKSVWRQGMDSGGGIDVAAIEIDRGALPANATFRCFTPQHLLPARDRVEIGTAILILGFPLGFYDQLHRTPVARNATIASSFGLRFQGKGYFLTDARTHRGSSGAPVVLRLSNPPTALRDFPWRLLGVHSATFDMNPREDREDEALGLNCAWYADILPTLTH